MCELVDYIVMHCIAGCRKKKHQTAVENFNNQNNAMQANNQGNPQNSRAMNYNSYLYE